MSTDSDVKAEGGILLEALADASNMLWRAAGIAKDTAERYPDRKDATDAVENLEAKAYALRELRDRLEAWPTKAAADHVWANGELLDWIAENLK